MLGYAYTPLPLSEPDLEVQLQRLGAQSVHIDWGERHVYQQLKAEPPQTLILLRLIDLGDSAVTIATELSFWQAQATEIIINGQSSSDPAHVQRWLVELPSQLQSRRLAIANAERRLQHLPPPGKAPFGYRRQGNSLAPDPRTIAIVKSFFQHFLLYGSLRGSIRHLQQRHNHTISLSTARRWLQQPVYRGDREYVDGTYLRNTQAAVIDRTDAAQIDRWRQRNRRLPCRSASAPHALAGLVICDHCHQHLRIVTAKAYIYLRCDTCRYSHPYATVLQTTIEQVGQLLPQRLAHPPTRATEPNIQTSIETSQAILNKLPELIAQGILDEATARLRRYQLEGQIDQAARDRDRQPPTNLLSIAQTLALPEFWSSLSAIEQRNYLREFLAAVHTTASGQIRLVFVFETN